STSLRLSDDADTYVDDDGGESISALGGDDLIQAMGGNDTLIGGTGNDRLEGGAGRDTYLFSIGDGQDVISDERGRDTIQFSEGVSSDEVGISSIIDDNGIEVLVLTYGISDSITIENWNLSPIEIIRFSDGTEWTQQQINQSLSLVAGEQTRDESMPTEAFTVFDVDTVYQTLLETNISQNENLVAQEFGITNAESGQSISDSGVQNIADILSVLVHDEQSDGPEDADARYNRVITSPPIIIPDMPMS
ncbi:calcium-binding protein, partial [Planctobacterium marinum]